MRGLTRSESAQVPDHSVSWVELLQDLVVVATVLVLFEGLVKGLEDSWWIWYAAALVAVYLVWLAEVVVVNGFPRSNLMRQIISMVWMTGMVIAATGVLWENWSPGWALCVGVAIVLTATSAQYFFSSIPSRGNSDVPVARMRSAAAMVLVGAVLAALAAVSPTGVSDVLLLISVVIGVLVPPLLLAGVLLDFHRLRESHLSERFGQLVLIMLGESFLEIVLGVREGGQFRPWLTVYTAIVVFTLWRAYFLLLLPAGPPRHHRRFIAWIGAHAVLVVGFGFAAASAGRWATSSDAEFESLGWTNMGVAGISVASAYVGIAAVAVAVNRRRVAGIYLLGAAGVTVITALLSREGILGPWGTVPLVIVLIGVNLIATRWWSSPAQRTNVGPQS